jgi:hypothetical protein
MDLDFLLGSAVTLIGMASAYGLGKRNRLLPASVNQAVCPCEHPISFHEGLTGPCHAPVQIRSYKPGAGTTTKPGTCRCQHYAGPELISSMTMREVLAVDPPQK